MILHLGDKVGPWTIVNRIGEGEYGEVYSCICWILVIKIGKCREFDNELYAMKVAKIEKNRFRASLISHEVKLLRIRLQAFSKDLSCKSFI